MELGRHPWWISGLFVCLLVEYGRSTDGVYRKRGLVQDEPLPE